MKYHDHQIIEAIKADQGNLNKHLEWLYKKHFRQAAIFFTQKGVSEEEIRDLFQDAVICFYETAKKGKFKKGYKISTFIIAIMKNRWINLIQRSQNETKYLDTISHQIEDDISESISFSETKQRQLDYYFKKLGDDCKRVLILFYYNNWSMHEIAKEMNLSNDQVARNKKSRCLKYLQNLIREKYHVKAQ